MDTQGMAAVIGVCPSPAQFRENNTEKQEPGLTPHLQNLKDDLTNLLRKLHISIKQPRYFS